MGMGKVRNAYTIIVTYVQVRGRLGERSAVWRVTVGLKKIGCELD